MRLRGIFFCLAVFLLPLHGLTSDKVVANPAAAGDVSALIPLAGLDKIVLANVKRTIDAQNRLGENPINSEIYLTYLTPEAISERIAPVLAKYISQDQAKKLFIALNTPTGKLSTKFRLLTTNSGMATAQAEFFKLPKPEQRALNEFNNSTVFKSLIHSETSSAAEVGIILKKWDDEIAFSKARVVKKELAEMIQHILDVERIEDVSNKSLVLPQKISRTGIINFDREAFATYRYLYKNGMLGHQLRQKLAKLNLAEILSGENLVSQRMLESSTLNILSTESLLNDFVKISEKHLTDLQTELDAIKMSDENRRALNARTSEQFETHMKVQLMAAERQRAVIEVSKRMLAFCESRLGKIEFTGGTLRFMVDADVETFNDLLTQLKKEQAELLRIEQDDTERREDTVRKLKSS